MESTEVFYDVARGVVTSAAKRFSQNTVLTTFETSDFIQEGWLAALKAMPRADCSGDRERLARYIWRVVRNHLITFQNKQLSAQRREGNLDHFRQGRASDLERVLAEMRMDLGGDTVDTVLSDSSGRGTSKARKKVRSWLRDRLE